MHQTNAAMQGFKVGAALPGALALALAGSCADGGADLAMEEGVSDPGTLALQSQGESPQTLQPPDGAYFAEITANGSGCPPGTTSTSISEDGQVFTTTFSSYEVSIGPRDPVAVKDCQLSIKLKSPGGLSYAVNSFSYSGYVFLEDGVSARQTANYYFQGIPLTSREVRGDVLGPRDEDYLFTDTVDTVDNYVWSPCDLERSLQINTRLRLVNGTPAGSGYMNLAALDGATRLVFKLAWQRCARAGSPPGAAPPEAPPPSAAPPDAAPPTTAPPPVPERPAVPPVQPPSRPRAPPPAQPPPRAPGGVVDGLGDVIDGLGGVVGGLGGVLGGILGGLTGAVGGLFGALLDREG